MMELHKVIDRIPELPYFFFAVVYVIVNPGKDYVHIFSVAFIFLLMGVFLGTAIKLIFKTPRPRAYKTIKIFSYGFPSLHSLISVGAISFLYFVDLRISLLLIPVCALYMYSRIKLRVHTRGDVVGGAIIGLIFGAGVGFFGLGVFLPHNIELLFSILFFIVPAAISYLRIKFIL